MAPWRIAGALLVRLLVTLALSACNDAPAYHPRSRHSGSTRAFDSRSASRRAHHWNSPHIKATTIRTASASEAP